MKSTVVPVFVTFEPYGVAQAAMAHRPTTPIVRGAFVNVNARIKTNSLHQGKRTTLGHPKNFRPGVAFASSRQSSCDNRNPTGAASLPPNAPFYRIMTPIGRSCPPDFLPRRSKERHP